MLFEVTKSPNSSKAHLFIVYQYFPHCLFLFPTWISNYILHRVWDENIYPFPNFNTETLEDWEWINDIIPHFTRHVIDFYDGLNSDYILGATKNTNNSSKIYLNWNLLPFMVHSFFHSRQIILELCTTSDILLRKSSNMGLWCIFVVSLNKHLLLTSSEIAFEMSCLKANVMSP